SEGKEGLARGASAMKALKPEPISPHRRGPKHHSSAVRLRFRRRIRPRVEWFEDRTLLSAFTVSNTADSGPGSFRQAILDSNAATQGSNTIEFQIPGGGVQTIAPTSTLPEIINSVLIDGFSQPGYSRTPLIELNSGQGFFGDALVITGS